VPFGSIGLTLFGIDFYFASTGLAIHARQAQRVSSETRALRILAGLALIGIFAASNIVPLYTLIQNPDEGEPPVA